jgi:3-dehydroquinate dehydratase-1
MHPARNLFKDSSPKVVGSFGSFEDLRKFSLKQARNTCDLVEIRLDLLEPETIKDRPWSHLKGLPLLFTARSIEEGGARAIATSARMQLLESVLDDADGIDIEVASIPGMEDLILQLSQRGIPWVASFHDFAGLPSPANVAEALAKAKAAHASVFKMAARLHAPGDLAPLADFQLADHNIPVATMGMGPLAPVSRLLCAQSGSVLNYGYIGSTPTAPGQWDCALLKQAISRLAAIRFPNQ